MVVVVWLLCPTLCDPMTVVHQVPLPMGFPKQEYWSGMPLPSPGELPKPGFKLASLALAGRFFTTEPPGKPMNTGVGGLALLQGIFPTQELN